MLWFIIFGIKDMKRVVGTGTFSCPYCKTTTPYRRYKVLRFFALYFIPLIPLGSREGFVHCECCGVGFPVDVLDSECGAATP